MLNALALVVALTVTADPLVPAKARGYSLETATVGGAAVLKANDHVDVIAVVTDPETKQQASLHLLQNVVVAATANAHVTLLLIPEEARLLALARANGQLTLVLRNEKDLEIIDERRPETLKTLLSHLKK
jgi:pilus assembly protein CpaB